MKKIVFLLVFVFLTGCKVESVFYVSSESFNSKANGTKITGKIIIEVSGCNSYEDSRKESDTLIKLKSAFAKYVVGGVYEECYSKGMQSYAKFAVPAVIDSISDGKVTDNKYINIATGNNNVFIVVPLQVVKKINKLKNSSIFAKTAHISMGIAYHNKKKQKQKFKLLTPLYVGVNRDPAPQGEVTISNGLSGFIVNDVAISYLLNNKNEPYRQIGIIKLIKNSHKK